MFALGWFEGRFESLELQFSPVYVFEPDMRLYLGRSIDTDSAFRAPSQQLVDEVSALEIEVLRCVILL